MLTPLREWLNSVGIETRAQISYGVAVETSEPIMAVDHPEAENFNQYDQVVIFRLWTGGAKLESNVLSTETGAQVPPFGERQSDLRDAYAAYAEVWVNGRKVGGRVSTNPTKVRRDVGGVGKPTIRRSTTAPGGRCRSWARTSGPAASAGPSRSPTSATTWSTA
ncbi:hypothetical protein [Motilibacter aurantiacus]|uniref:hypothetical protein n=1 Tax=Motilibacter aurantiacus TaxID=2714955 RepID=UPI0018C8B5FB|nr:hypothetical protein [Motilibacter aurantiacus]